MDGVAMDALQHPSWHGDEGDRGIGDLITAHDPEFAATLDSTSLTPLPIRALEASLFRLLAALVRDRAAFVALIRRFMAQVTCIGHEVDATTRMGMERTADILAMLHATRPTLDCVDYLDKNYHASIYRRIAPRMHLLLEQCAIIDVPNDSPWTDPQLDAVLRWRRDLGLAERASCIERLRPSRDERRLFGVISELWSRPGDLGRAIDRLTFFANAQGLALGVDADLADGLRLALDALVLLHALRQADGPDEVREKAALITAHQSHGRDHVGLALALLLNCDRMAFCMSPDDLA